MQREFDSRKALQKTKMKESLMKIIKSEGYSEMVRELHDESRHKGMENVSKSRRRFNILGR
jgi:hypothetical protein